MNKKKLMLILDSLLSATNDTELHDVVLNNADFLEEVFEGLKEELVEVPPNDERVESILNISLDTVVELDMEQFLDLLEEHVCGHMNAILSDISYETVGINKDGSIQIKVTGFLVRTT